MTRETFADEPPRLLRWKKDAELSDGWSPVYVATDDRGVAGGAVQTGRRGVDDYPWDWHVVPLHEAPADVRVRLSGAADTLRSAKDQAELAARWTR